MAIFTLCICKKRLVNILICKDKKYGNPAVYGNPAGSLGTAKPFKVEVLRTSDPYAPPQTPKGSRLCSFGAPTARKCPPSVGITTRILNCNQVSCNQVSCNQVSCNQVNCNNLLYLQLKKLHLGKIVRIAVLGIIDPVPIFFTKVPDVTPLPVVFIRNGALFLGF